MASANTGDLAVRLKDAHRLETLNLTCEWRQPSSLATKAITGYVLQSINAQGMGWFNGLASAA
jgi:hypothetical protein